MSADAVYRLTYDKKIANMMFEAKQNELLQVADKYNISIENLQSELDKELSKSKMKVGGCNTAIGFFIVETLDDNKLYKSVKDGIAHNIFSAAIYWANVAGKSEYI